MSRNSGDEKESLKKLSVTGIMSRMSKVRSAALDKSGS